MTDAAKEQTTEEQKEETTGTTQEAKETTVQGDSNASLLSDVETTETTTEVEVDDTGKPKGLPDNVFNEAGEIDSDALVKEYLNANKRAKGLRDKLAQGLPKPPEKPDEYAVEFDEDTRELVPDDDPLLVKTKEIALEAGLSKEQFETLAKKWVAGAKEVLAERGEAATEMTEEQYKEYVEAEKGKLGANPDGVIRAVTEFVRQQQAQGQLSEDEVEYIHAIASTATGVKILNKWRTMVGGQDVPINTAIDDGLPSDKEILSMMNEKDSEGKVKYYSDETYRKKIDEMLERRVAVGRPPHLQAQ